MVLKCVMCNSIIFPNLPRVENEEVNWVYCSTCDMTDCTDEQWNRFQATVNKQLAKDNLPPVMITRPKKEPPKPPRTWDEEYGDRYAKVDI